MVRYDAVIVGAGGEGLAASIALADAGLKALLIERQPSAGGRLCAREFHPGFRASPFCDAVAEIPAAIFHELQLARHGAVLVRPECSVALWPGAPPHLLPWTDPAAAAMRAALLARSEADALAVPPRFSFLRRERFRAWPGEIYAQASLAGLLGAALGDGEAMAHTLARAAGTRALDPHVTGTAIHLLAAEDHAILPAGAASLAAALEHRARAAGVEILTGVDAQEFWRRGNRVTGLKLSDGREIEARAAISTLDLRQTFLSLFEWKSLPGKIAARVRQYRMGAASARLLIALDAPPQLPANARGAQIYVAPSAALFANAFAAWRDKTIAAALPLVLQLPSALDPSAAPPGQSVLTATASSLPAMLFDGGWTHARREALTAQILAQIEAVWPGISARILATALIAPPDFEDGIGATQGDVHGGELAPDQFAGFRPWLNGTSAPRTPLAGLYLAGGATLSGTLATCLSGTLAARALLADLNAGRLP